MKRFKITLFHKKLIVLAAGLVLFFFAGYQMGERDYHVGISTGRVTFLHANPPSNQTVDWQLFWNVYDTVQQNFYDKSKIDGQKMLYGAIQGMVSSLGDPYTAFLNPDQNKAVTDQLSGTYQGVGIQLGYKDNKLVVMAPLDGSPAKAAGVKAGDLIIKIGDKSAEGMSLPDAVTLIRGNAGTSISMAFLHEGSTDTYTVNLTRANIQVKSVTFTDKGNGIGYIQLSQFGDNTNSEWDAAVNQTIQAKSKAIILDLRDNPGGYLNSAVYVGSEFVSSGIIVQQVTGGNTQQYSVERPGKLTNVPVIVLVNKGSASASEILSGALQDYGRGELVGTQTFGKGIVQEVEDVKCNKPTADAVCPSLHITTSKWLTPKGRWIQGTGLTPDVIVNLTNDDFKVGRDPQLDKAMQLAQSKL